MFVGGREWMIAVQWVRRGVAEAGLGGLTWLLAVSGGRAEPARMAVQQMWRAEVKMVQQQARIWTRLWRSWRFRAGCLLQAQLLCGCACG